MIDSIYDFADMVKRREYEYPFVFLFLKGEEKPVRLAPAMKERFEDLESRNFTDWGMFGDFSGDSIAVSQDEWLGDLDFTCFDNIEVYALVGIGRKKQGWEIEKEIAEKSYAKKSVFCYLGGGVSIRENNNHTVIKNAELQ